MYRNSSEWKEEDTHDLLAAYPSPSLSITSLNSTTDPSGMKEYDVSTVWKAMVSEIEN